jgi:acyl carrier protein
MVPYFGRSGNIASGQSLIIRYSEFPSCRGFDLLHNYLKTPAFCSRIGSLILTETGKTVAGIYAKVLGLEWVNPADDIFELGGDSLEAVQIALALERHFEISLPVETLESSSRVCDVANWIDSLRRGAGDDGQCGSDRSPEGRL